MQPLPVVYVIEAVPPAMPVTSPAADIVAMPVAPELHVPPVTTSCSAEVPPMHTVGVPVIAGNGLTVTTVFETQPAAPEAE